MEAEVKSSLTISFEQEEIKSFIEIIDLIANKPHSVGFNKKDFTEEQWEFIRQLHSLFIDEYDSNIRV